MEKQDKILVLGATGLVGSAVVRILKQRQYTNILTPNSTYLDLTSPYITNYYFSQNQPHYVINCAGKVGGILANQNHPVDFLSTNALIQLNTINASYKFGVKKLVNLGSSCIYPKDCPQPMKAEHLLSGTLEPTNEPYALAKIMGVKLCQAYKKQHGFNAISLMPCNVYGINDNMSDNGHVIGGLVQRIWTAKIKQEPKVNVWGSGKPLREFIYSEDLADAILFAMDNYHGIEPLNVGTGEEISIKELAMKISLLIGYDGELVFDQSKPDGTMRKLLDSSHINSLGWKHSTSLNEGILISYLSYLYKNNNL